MKKAVVIFLTLIMVCLVGCSGSSNNGGNKSSVLVAETNLPAFSDDFNMILESVDDSYISGDEINEVMGYLLAAYNTYGAQDFCDYVYEKDYGDFFNEIRANVSNKATSLTETGTTEERKNAVTMSLIAYEISSANLELAQFRTKYAGSKVNTFNVSYDELKGLAVDAINSYAQIFYDGNLL